MSWKSVKIPDVLFFQEGPGVRNTQFTNHGVKLLNVGNINFGNLNLDATKIYISDEEAYGKYKHFLVDEGDLLIASSGIVVNNFHNKITWASKEHLPLCLNTSTIRFKTLDPNVLDIRYFSYFLKTRLFADQLAKLITGSAQLNFGSSHLKQISLPLPPLATQKRIAEILDAAEAFRRKDQEMLKKYDELAQAIFIDMFGDPVKNVKGWDVKSLDKITTKLGDGIHGTPNYSMDGNYYFINGNNLENGTIIVNQSTKKVDENEFLKHKKELNENTMLVSINGTIGKVAFYKGENIILGKSACYFNIDKMQVAPIYLYSLIKSNYFINYAGGNATGSTIKNVSLKTMREFPVPLPPISIQMIYDERITLIWESIKIVNINEEKLLFNSLILKAFNGELV